MSRFYHFNNTAIQTKNKRLQANTVKTLNNIFRTYPAKIVSVNTQSEEMTRQVTIVVDLDIDLYLNRADLVIPATLQ